MESAVFAVIPAYNEGISIKGIVSETRKYIKNIILVDDGSKDDTAKEAESQGIKVLKHIINLGKGAALKTGCDYAIEKGADRIIVLDADAQHEPSEIPRFLEELNDADVVLGCRELGQAMPFILRLGNIMINRITKILYSLDLHDTQCGYRAFTAEAYRQIRWRSSSYSMESEMIANIGKKGLKYREIGIKTIYNDRYKGTTVIDGIKVVFNMIWWRLSG
ncbi:glycosyltransferase family 2 protein [Candidatus Woesearchaeota archaeon]|nr:glycosyltransferase family 2 protein [Candidatus Woesearchaeota archaeon]